MVAHAEAPDAVHALLSLPVGSTKSACAPNWPVSKLDGRVGGGVETWTDLDCPHATVEASSRARAKRFTYHPNHDAHSRDVTPASVTVPPSESWATHFTNVVERES